MVSMFMCKKKHVNSASNQMHKCLDIYVATIAKVFSTVQHSTDETIKTGFFRNASQASATRQLDALHCHPVGLNRFDSNKQRTCLCAGIRNIGLLAVLVSCYVSIYVSANLSSGIIIRYTIYIIHCISTNICPILTAIRRPRHQQQEPYILRCMSLIQNRIVTQNDHANALIGFD